VLLKREQSSTGPQRSQTFDMLFRCSCSGAQAPRLGYQK
jgi:hypothetical protein